MANPHRRERVTGDEPFKPLPIEGFALASAIKMAKQNSLGLAVELIHRLAIERCRIVLDVSPQLGSEHAPQFLERQHSLAENSIFTGTVRVARRQIGCVRFSYVPSDSRTPRRHHCQPDGALAKIPAEVDKKLATVPRPVTVAERDAMRERLTAEALVRVAPYFDSLRHGTPDYLRLSECVADEITRGADDESEMGVYHDLFEPQRLALMGKRLNEYVPANTVAAVLFAS